MFRYIPAFCSGAFVLLLLSRDPNSGSLLNGLNLFWTLLLLTGTLLFAVALEYRQSREWLRWRELLLIAIVFGLGMSYALYESNQVIAARWKDDLDGNHSRVLEGEVVSLPHNSSNYTRFTLQIRDHNTLSDSESALIASSRVQLIWFTPQFRPKLGEQLRLKVLLKEPRSTFNPPLFDEEKRMFLGRISGEGRVLDSPLNERLEEASRPTIAYWRQNIWERLNQLSGDSDARAILTALVVGEKSTLSSESRALFSRMGVSHLISISGLHIGLIAGWVILLVRWGWSRFEFLSRRLSPIYAAALCGLFVATLYAFLAGFTVPTQRALLMLASALLAMLSRRVVAPLNLFLLALFGVILLDPLAMLGVGFWLSFVAVATIYLAIKRCSNRPAWVQLIGVQGAIFLMMSPLQLLFFGETSLVSPLVNLVAIPLFSFAVVPSALLVTLLLYLTPSLGNTLGEWWISAVAYWIKGLAWIDGWVVTQVSLPHLSSALLLVLMVSLVSFLLFHSWKSRGITLLLLSLIVPILLFNWSRLPSGEVAVQVLDIGQGLSVIVQTRHHIMVYDTGPPYSRRVTQAERILIPLLKKRRVRHLDKLIISHSHNDHSSGLKPLQQHFTIGQTLSGEPKLLGDSSVEACVAGESWKWDGVLFEMLHPEKDHTWIGNSASCVLRISVGEAAMLLTGDLEKDAERVLVRDEKIKLQSDLLVVPHHGSLTSSTENFLRQVAPEHAIVPAGYRNRYNLPAPSLLKRYRESEICVWNTAWDGAMEFRISAKGVNQLFSSRRKYGKIWTLMKLDPQDDCI